MSGGSGSVGVTVATGCPWTASSSDTSWLTITGGSSGNGNGTAFFSVASNSSTSSHQATLTVAGQPFTVTQAGVGSYPLTVSAQGSGTGTVTSNTGGINCGTGNTGSCITSLASGTSVSLTATQTGASSFGGWGGDCAGQGTPCALTMNGPKNVTATFNAPSTYSLTVTPPSNGMVTGSGISCPGDCSEPYSSGTPVSLTANSATGYSFGSWGGDCTGQGNPCTLTMYASKTVSATFTAIPPPPPSTYTLTVSAQGTGTGTVTSNPGGINCPGTCTATFSTAVTLTAQGTNGSTFAGWSGGGCSGFGTCTVSSAATVTATFNPPNQLPDLTTTIAPIPSSGAVGDVFQLSASVSNQEPGAAGAFALGAYFSTDATIDTGDRLFAACGFTELAPGDSRACNGQVHIPTSLSPGVYFVGIIADYLNVVTESNEGNNTAVTGPITVTGSPQISDLTVALNGSGTGTVTSDQGGIICGSGNTGTCSTTLTNGVSVTLTATPTSPATFGGWDGDCAFAGTATTCTLTMTASRAVTATFNPPSSTFSLSVGVPASGTGTVTSDQGGIICGSGNTGTCSTTLTNGVSVTLTATPTSPATFGGWDGDCAFAGTATTCTLTMTASRAVTATFNPPPPPGYFSLSVIVQGSGTGSVTSSVGGINCGVGNSGTCTASLLSESDVTLTATATGGSIFVGWGGDCAADGTVTLDAAKTCTATFAATVVGPLIVSTTSPPTGEQGAAYGYALQAEGGTPPYTWSLGGGKKNKLPQGLTLTTDGILGGIPTKAKTATFTVQVTDATYALATKNLSLQIVKGVKFKTKLGKGKVGTPYSATLQTTGGIAPPTFSLIGGALPPGLTLDPATGQILGTPTAAGTFNFQVRVASSGGSSDQKGMRIKIK